jgi:predicted deacylase
MSDKPLVLLNRQIEKGQGAILELEIAKLHTRHSIKIPIIVERAKTDGPVLLLMAGVHGDEINGVAIIRDMILKKLNKPRSGTVICVPVLNVFGYLNLSREFPDGRDLNRVFPGSEKGSLASQFAYRFMHEIAPHVDYIIDFHTGGAERDNYPFIRCQTSEDHILELAKVFNAPFIINSKNLPKTLRETCQKMGKPMLLFEGGKSKNLDEFVIETGINGALNVMTHLGMLPGPVNGNSASVVIEKSKWIRSPHSGMLQLNVENGSTVLKGALLGKITDPYGAFLRKLHAPFDCYVFGVNTSPVVHKGDALFHVSVP